MQKQKKQLLVMVLLLVAGILAYAGLRLYNSKQEEKQAKKEEAEKIAVTSLQEDEITDFSYQYEGETLEFKKEEDTWYYVKDRTISIDADKISAMLEAVAALTAETEVKDYENLADYGLKEPANTIVLKTADTAVTLYLGSKNEMLSQYYIKKEGDDTVYLISNALETVFGKSVADLTKAEESTETVEETETE